MTNFATHIDSANDRAPIAQRGHAKQKRTDLRIVGLGLVVSIDGGIPLVSHTYAGNRPDVTQFAALVQELVARFGALSDEGKELTLVYDAGQNSEDNAELIEGSALHFVGSLPPSDHPELLAVAKSRYRPVDKVAFPGLNAFETTKVVFGAERRVVVTTPRTSTTSSPGASTRRWGRPSAPSLSSGHASGGERRASPRNRSRRRSPRSSSPAGSPG